MENEKLNRANFFPLSLSTVFRMSNVQQPETTLGHLNLILEVAIRSSIKHTHSHFLPPL